MGEPGSTEKELHADFDDRVYEQIIHSVADHLGQQGFSEVRANSEGFSKPERVRWDEEDEGVIPHITARHGNAVFVFEIETREKVETQQVEDRWRLLSAYARRHHGKLYLVIPESRAYDLRKFAAKLDIRTEFLKLSGID